MDDILATVACQFVIGQVHSEELPRIATDALLRGVDSPALRQLAGLNTTELREAADLLQAALDELGVAIPSEDEALWRLVRDTATKIVSGDLPPYQGALWIWRNAAHRVQEEGDLRIFIGLASERQDHPEDSDKLDRAIVEAAGELLLRNAPRRWLRVQARHGEPPLSRSTAEGLSSVRASDLGLRQSITDALVSWAADYDDTFAGDVRDSGFDSEGDAEAFVDRGRRLASELQAELGESWNVEFYPEPIRPPGLRLRAR